MCIRLKPWGSGEQGHFYQLLGALWREHHSLSALEGRGSAAGMPARPILKKPRHSLLWCRRPAEHPQAVRYSIYTRTVDLVHAFVKYTTGIHKHDSC